jgi:hypothetical protein
MRRSDKPERFAAGVFEISNRTGEIQTMKKFLLVLPILLVLVVSSCKPTSQGNLNNNTPGDLVPLANEEVTITAEFVNSAPPELIIKVDKDPVRIKARQKINWNIVYKAAGGSTQKLNVVVDDFKSVTGEGTADLFQDGSAYNFSSLSPNGSVSPKLTGEAKPGTTTEFKYRISFLVADKFKFTVDPRIVIDAGFHYDDSKKRD